MKFIRKYFKLAIVLIILCAMILPGVFGTKIKTEGFDSENAYNTTKELSSDKYKGRRYGTSENLEAVKYIEDKFKEIGLEPAGENGSYRLNDFEFMRTYNGVAVLELLDSKGKLIKSFKYGDDFIEQGYDNSVPGELTAGFNFTDYREGYGFQKANDNAKIAVNSSKLTGTDIQIMSSKLSEAGFSALINVVPDSTNLWKQSSGVGIRTTSKSGYEVPTLIIKDNIKRQLAAYEGSGAVLHVKSTFDAALGQTPSVLGMIKGTGSEYLLVTAHLDNIGPTSDGTVYPGALDNASGVGTMIEVARFIKSQNKKPSKNILFIAFNGEEGGLLGSKHYIDKGLYPIGKSTVINLDMIGATKDIPLTLMYSTNNDVKQKVDPAYKIRNQFKKMAQSMGIKTKEMESMASDHGYFDEYLVPAVTLTDYDDSLIHTSQDNISNVGVKNIDRALKLVVSYVALSAYSNFSVNGYSIALDQVLDFIKILYPILLCMILLTIFFKMHYNEGKLKFLKAKGKVPLFSILFCILALGIIVYFPIDYTHTIERSSAPLGLLWQAILGTLQSLILIPADIAFVLPGAAVIFIRNKLVTSPRFNGNVKLSDIIFKIAMASVVLVSTTIAIWYNDFPYDVVTPDFARNLVGKICLFILVGFIAVEIFRLLCFEMGLRGKGYRELIIFSVVFFILIYSFYMPISFNKYTTGYRTRGMSSISTSMMQN